MFLFSLPFLDLHLLSPFNDITWSPWFIWHVFLVLHYNNTVKESDSDTIIMVIFLVVGVGGIFILFAIMALCYRLVL